MDVREIKFSKRQEECLSYTLKGYSAKKIAQTLNLSPRTIERYLEDIKNKIGCRTKYQLLALFYQLK